MNNWVGYFLYILSGIVVAISQILLKLSANSKYKSFIRQYLNVKVIAGYGLLFGSMVINMFAMRYIDYKFAPILSTVSYIFVLIFSVLVLREKIVKKQFWGIVMIFFGIIIFNL